MIEQVFVALIKFLLHIPYKEIFRVLKKGGLFFYNCYSDDHTSCVTAETLDNGMTTNIKKGTLAGYCDLSFYNKKELLNYFSTPWNLKQIIKKTSHEINEDNIHSEFQLIIQKND